MIISWRYAEGPGRFRLLQGTEKWKGIEGEGTTLGMLKQQQDDHYMLKSEIHWRINNSSKEG